LLTRDALRDDDRAIVEIPPVHQLRVGVYSNDASALRPLFSTNPYVETSFKPAAPVMQAPDADVVVLDGFEPNKLPEAGIVWLKPPQGSSVRIRSHVTNTPIVRWRADHELCAGLHGNAVQLEAADVLIPQEGDTAIAEVEAGPVILARTKPHRMVLLGYHPGLSDSRFDVMTPLLFANILRWLKPDAFRTWEVHAETVGVVNVRLDNDEAAGSDLRVTDEHGEALPFNVHAGALRFYSGSPGNMRVRSARGDRVYSLTLPEVGETEWTFPATAAAGFPPVWSRPLAHDIWQLLAAAGVLLLIVDWLLYGRARRIAPLVVSKPEPRAFAKKAS
jgi:hypothetical protein